MLCAHALPHPALTSGHCQPSLLQKTCLTSYGPQLRLWDHPLDAAYLRRDPHDLVVIYMRIPRTALIYRRAVPCTPLLMGGDPQLTHLPLMRYRAALN